MTISDSLIKTVGDNGAKDILSAMGEITLDSVINNDSINQIPIIGTLRNLYRITNSISDYLFIQKLLKFLNELGEISDDKKEKMKYRIKTDEKYKDKVGENLLEIINKIDDLDKTRLIARLFAAFIDERISLQIFFKYSQIVNKSFLPDLQNITKYVNGEVVSIEESSSLLGLGLLEVKTKTMSGPVSLGGLGRNNQIEFILNPIGKQLYEFLR